MTKSLLGNSLSDLQQVPEIRKKLESLRYLIQFKPDMVVPWIGAGFSARYGLPTWRSFLDNLIAQLDDQESKNVAHHLMQRCPLDLVADYLHSRIGPEFDRQMRRTFENPRREPPRPHPLARLNMQTIVTTNYDRLLETSLRGFLAVTPDNCPASLFRDEDQHIIYKLHGTIEVPASWVLTRTQYAQRYNSALYSQLQTIFRTRVILFIGCSLLSDQYIDTLSNVYKNDRTEHFAIVSLRENDDGREIAERFDRIGIRMIPYVPINGQHTAVDEIIDYLSPSIEQTAVLADTMIRTRRFQRAELILQSWIDAPPTRTGQRELLVKLIVDLVAEAESTGRAALASSLRLAIAAAELSPNSRRAIALVRDTLEREGLPSTEWSNRYIQISRERPDNTIQIFQSPSASDDPISRLYSLYREGAAQELIDFSEAIRRRGNYPSDRILIYTLRGLLLVCKNEEALELWESEASPQLIDYGRALVFFALGNIREAIAALDRFGRGWRATRERGLSFSLYLRALCAGAKGDKEGFAFEVERTWQSYIPKQITAARRFRQTRSELCFDVRSFDSFEMVGLLEFWKFVATTARVRSIDELARAQLKVCLENCSSGDLLVSWCVHILNELAPDAVLHHLPLSERFRELQLQTRNGCPGLFSDIRLGYLILDMAGVLSPIGVTHCRQL